jgi:hypothetical protein
VRGPQHPVPGLPQPQAIAGALERRNVVDPEHLPVDLDGVAEARVAVHSDQLTLGKDRALVL